MSITNAQIAELLRRYAATLSLEGVDRFKLKAYRQAAETIEGLTDNVSDLVKRGSDLTALPGIGKSISGNIVEIVQRGKLGRLDQTVARLPKSLVELTQRPDLDPKKVLRIYKKLGISSLAELRQSLDAGTIGNSLGQRLEYHVHQGLDERPRRLNYDVSGIAGRIEQHLQSLRGVIKAQAAGSLRRKQPHSGLSRQNGQGNPHHRLLIVSKTRAGHRSNHGA